jgi:two-component system LytT family response regulator
MLRVVLLDDERSAISLLKHKLLKNFPEEIEVVATFEFPEEVIEAMPHIKADILFLDMEMPGMSGLEVAKQLADSPLKLIFTTAYPQYAIDAIRTKAFDYLVKPIDESDLKKAIERVLEAKYAELSRQAQDQDLVKLTQSLVKSQSTVPKLSVPNAEGLLLIPITEIVRIEGSGSYATIHTLHKQKILASKNLSEFEELLAAHPNFFRTHKSHLINLNHVNKYIRGEGGTVVMSDGSEVEVARRRKEEFLQRL